MNNPGSNSLSATRRGFLQRFLAAAAGVFAMATAEKAIAQEASSEDKPASAQSQGYRETDHIRAYYRTARF